jgi:hypothetical protein
MFFFRVGKNLVLKKQRTIVILVQGFFLNKNSKASVTGQRKCFSLPLTEVRGRGEGYTRSKKAPKLLINGSVSIK